MRPTRLVMTNFMPYAQETELDLSGLHLACLAGENGHGKSAIIDAITWALWGKARARRDDELIHLGEQQMEVRLDFQLGQETYRVIRQRDSAGRGNSTLEFQVGHNGHWSPLTGDSMRETQEIIEGTLHLDYDTFINSALLLQGRADEFTNQPPGERKRILGEILNLSQWDLLEERAKACVREAEAQLLAIQSKAEVMRGDLEKLPDHEAALEEAAREAERLGNELGEAKELLAATAERATEITVRRQILAGVDGELLLRGGELKSIRARIQEVQEHGLPEADQELKLRTAELAEIKVRIKQADTTRPGVYRLQVKEVQERLTTINERETRRECVETERAEIAEKIAALNAANSALKAAMDELREEMNALQAAGAVCPTCESELTEERRGDILAAKEARGKEQAASWRANGAEIEKLREMQQAREGELADIKVQLAKAPALRQSERDLVAKITLAESIEARLAEWETQVTTIEAAIAGARERSQAMKEARITEWEEQAHGLEAQILELEQQIKALEAELREEQEIVGRKRELEQTVDRLATEVSRANLRVGAAQQQIEHCQYLRAEAQKLEAQQQEEGTKKATFDALRVAFGKKGIQAMIIETVLPEIQEEANRLLGQMSDGRMSVAFESQRETKKGDISETLDILVSDELGVRSYDLFSGGERFRLDFAIRIAISKLLARRAGARLQTLIMDEGFGSQDAAGRDRLVEAIQSVAGDFELIVVVTHIDELREAFPNRIEVVKGPAGSLISVN